MMKRLAILLAGLASWQAAPACADYVNYGSYNPYVNEAPFGSTSYSGEYQQIYNGTNFGPGPTTITAISFIAGPIVPLTLETVGFTLSLSTTATFNSQTPSTDYAANRGSNFTQVFSGTETALLAGEFSPGYNNNSVFTINIAPFLYDPSQGALLMDVDITTSPSAIFGFSFGFNPLYSSVFSDGYSSAVVSRNYGLGTTFTTAPEPSSVVLCGIAGAVGLGVARFCRGR